MRLRIAILVAIFFTAVGYVALLPPIPQDPTYHHFADHRAHFGLANFFDVASNTPFLVVGIWGLLVVFNRRTVFLARDERWPYAMFFFGVGLTSVGSSYYHLQPDNARLVWDRLPMTFGFMGILSAILLERVSRKVGLLSMPLLVSAGALSVIYWRATETSGHGDLRPYLLVQFGSLVIVFATLLLFRSRYTQQRWLLVALALYVAAKCLELCDQSIFATLHLVSGHTLKHLSAAGAAYCIAHMLLHRNSINRDTLRGCGEDNKGMFSRLLTESGE